MRTKTASLQLTSLRYDVSWKEFTDRAASANDKELISKITIVEKYKDLLPGYIKILEEQAQYGIDDPRCEPHRISSR